MSYRLKKLPLTSATAETGASLKLIRLSSRRGRLPKSAFTNFHILARRHIRKKIRPTSEIAKANRDWLARVGVKRRHQDAARKLKSSDAFAIIVPLHRGNAIPRLDEVLRLLTGLELARQLRTRKVGNVVTVLWPCLQPTELADGGANVIIQRDGSQQDVSFNGGEIERYLQHIQRLLPGTDFSPLIQDHLARCADEDADVFKSRLLLRWLDDENLTLWKPSEGQFNSELRELSKTIPLLGHIGSGTSLAGIAPEEAVPFPSVSATIVEGKIEKLQDKMNLEIEALLAGEISTSDIAKRIDAQELVNAIKTTKELVLSSVLQMEMELNDLAFRPDAAISKTLTNADIGFGKLQKKLQDEAAGSFEIERKQAERLSNYLLPSNRPQQESMSLLHYLNFYGLEFLDGLRDVIEIDDMRHQAVYLADKT